MLDLTGLSQLKCRSWNMFYKITFWLSVYDTHEQLWITWLDLGCKLEVSHVQIKVPKSQLKNKEILKYLWAQAFWIKGSSRLYVCIDTSVVNTIAQFLTAHRGSPSMSSSKWPMTYILCYRCLLSGSEVLINEITMHESLFAWFLPLQCL